MRNIRISEELYRRLLALITDRETPQEVIEKLLDKQDTLRLRQVLPQEGVPEHDDLPYELITQIYPLAKAMSEGEIDLTHAQATLVSKLHMDANIARIYLEAFQRIRKGRSYGAICPMAANYFLQMILQDYDQQAHDTACTAIKNNRI